MQTTAPTCNKCKEAFPPELFNVGSFEKCPNCRARVWIEVFPNFGRKPSRGTGGELSVGGEEARCYYHETKKAAEVCDICGRFLCGLCDCLISGRHYCPNCLEAGKSNRQIRELDSSRTLYGRQALLLSILPLYITGILAVFIALRYRKAPESIVQPRRWVMPTALVLGLIQTILFTAWIVMAIMS